MFRKIYFKLKKKRLNGELSTRFARFSSIYKTNVHIAPDDYQYLHKSKLPTLHFQKGLFRLPIPELEKTCERYLNSLKPLLLESQWENTKLVVQKFQDLEGKLLHTLLKTKDANNKDTSYISKPWFDMYLKDRTPLPLNYNPAIVFNRSKRSDTESQLCKATNMTISSLRFMKALRSNILSPEIFHMNAKKTDTNLFNTVMKLLPPSLAIYGAYLMKAYPLDMSQHRSLFNSTRIPQQNKDILFRDESGKHILVLRNGHFFKMNVLNENGDILPPEVIHSLFHHIITKDLKKNEKSVGILTTENRDIWAKARDHLLSINPDNTQLMRTIDSSLFVVCLEEESVGEDPRKVMRTFLHGDGLNRWFDKSFSLIISKDGIAAVNFEHSWGDGVAVLRYIKDIFADVNTFAFTTSSTKISRISCENFLEQLDFKLDDRSINNIVQAEQKFKKLCDSLSIDIVQQLGLGKQNCIPESLSPDALMQLSFQVAYHKVYGNFVSTYESCSTSGFKHGRTEAIRPCTEATKNFSLSFNSKDRPGKQELMRQLKICSEVHKNLTKEAIMGQGFDRHLFGLKCICEEKGLQLPELFEDDAYKIINHNILSTSTLAADAIMVGGFGPVVVDGLGVGYSILKSECGAIITSYPENKNGADFANALKATFEELKLIIDK